MAAEGGARAGSAPRLVVLAAGRGHRFGGPKQLEPVGPSGETLAEYAIFDALRHGFAGVVLVVREEIESALRARLERLAAGRAETRFVVQRIDDLPPGCPPAAGRGKPWGTGHALLSCREAVPGPFAVVNADDFYGEPALRALGRFLFARPEPGRYCAAVYRLADTLSPHGEVSRGLCAVSPDRRLERIAEVTGIRAAPEGIRGRDGRGAEVRLEPDRVVSMNAWGFTPDLFGHLDAAFRAFLARSAGDGESEFRLPDVVGELVGRGAATVELLPAEARWTGLTCREDLPDLRAALARRVAAGEYPDPLWSVDDEH